MFTFDRRISLLLAAAALTAGCTEKPKGTRPIATVELSYITRTDLTDAGSGPAEAVTLTPRRDGKASPDSLPALLATPPAAITLTVPGDVNARMLEFMFGLGGEAYDAETPVLGTVSLAVEAAGEVVFETSLPTGPDVPRTEQIWTPVEVPLRGARELTLRTSFDGDGEAPQVGLGEARLISRRRVPIRFPEDGPNVVLVVIDTLRADALSCYGETEGTSPNLDAFAERGMRFDRAFSAAPWTWPSTASILTGLTPPEHGVLGGNAYRLADEWQTIAEAMEQAGYRTSGFSCNPLIARNRNFAQGFSQFKSYPWTRSREMFDDIDAWLRRAYERSFFLYVHWIDPHQPYEPSGTERELFAGPDPDGYVDQLSRDLVQRYYAGDADVEERMRSLVAHEWELYRSEVVTVDDSFGRLIALLEELDVLDNTIVAVTSDHGEEFLDHGHVGHGKQVFDESVRVPLIAAGPGIDADVVVAEPVENRFLSGSLLELVGAPRSGNLGGPNLFRANAQRDEPFYFHTSPGRWVERTDVSETRVNDLLGVRDGDYLYVWSPDGELEATFDLANDPEALSPLTGDDRSAGMRRLAEEWWSRARANAVGNLSGDEAMIDELEALGYLGD